MTMPPGGFKKFERFIICFDNAQGAADEPIGEFFHQTIFNF